MTLLKGAVYSTIRIKIFDILYSNNSLVDMTKIVMNMYIKKEKLIKRNRIEQIDSKLSSWGLVYQKLH